MASRSGVERIKADEGRNPRGHLVQGILHIGIGSNLETDNARERLLMAGVHPRDLDSVMKVNGKVLTPEQVDALFDLDLRQAEVDAGNSFLNFSTVPQSMKDVLVNMSFQLGKTRLNQFKKLRQAVEGEDWAKAADEMLASKWAKKDAKTRAKRLVKEVRKIQMTPIPSPISRSTLARVRSAEKEFQQQLFNQRADALSSVFSREFVIDSLANALRKQKSTEQVAEGETPTPTPPDSPQPEPTTETEIVNNEKAA